VPLCPILSISERNLAFMGVGGIPRIQLEFAESRRVNSSVATPV